MFRRALCKRSVEFSDAVMQSAKERGVEAVSTIENPAPRKDKPHFPSLWYLPEVKQWMKDWAVMTAEYNACAYGAPYYKPQWFVGLMTTLGSLSKKCSCNPPIHTPCVGSETGPSA